MACWLCSYSAVFIMVFLWYGLPTIETIWLDRGTRDPTKSRSCGGSENSFFRTSGSPIATAGLGAGWNFRYSSLFTTAVAFCGLPTYLPTKRVIRGSESIQSRYTSRSHHHHQPASDSPSANPESRPTRPIPCSRH
jgi:hypothetical protein